MPSFNDAPMIPARRKARNATQDRANALNMRNYKPRRPAMTLDDVVTPEIRDKRAAMLQGARDEAMMESAGSAYDQAMPAPAGPGGGGMKKGGSVGSASSRADGCAVKGKTKGRMI